MIKQLVALLALVALAEASSMLANVDLTLVHDLAMINIWPDSYALSDPALAQQNWKTVSVNGAEATIYSPTCDRLVKPVSEFTKEELDLLNQTTTSGDFSKPKETTTIVLAVSGTFRIGSGNSYMNPDTNPRNVVMLKKEDVIVQKIDDKNFSVQKTGLANNLDGVWVFKNVVSFVYNDNTVLMKPTACLETDELELLEQLKSELPK